MASFEVGKTYQARSIGDSDCVFRITVAKRTARQIVTTDGKRLGVSMRDDDETVMPLGRYSMAPVIRASRAV